MIQLSNLSKSFGDRVLLDSVSWQIDNRERVGLSGPNGAGKTTLLKMLAGLDEPDGGLVVKPAGLTIGYLPQDGLHHTGRTLIEEAGQAFKTLLDMRAEIAALEDRLADDSAHDSEHEGMLTRYSELQESFRRLEGYSVDLKIATVLRGLGFSKDGHGEADRHVLGRLADAHRARQAPARPAGPAAPRRADEPSRPRGPQLARGISLRLPPRRHPRLARSLLPRRRRHAHHRHRPAHADRLPRELQQLPRRARRAHGAAAAAEARPGRRGRAHEGLHRSLPLPGDQGGAGPEPDQDDGQDRPHRDSARAQARPLHVSRVREERPHGARPARRLARPTARAASSTASTCSSSAAIASPSSAPTASASRR